jgi:hypothetical protein
MLNRPKLSRGKNVLVAPSTTRTEEGYSWGVRVFDPEWSQEVQRRDRENGDILNSAGEPHLYSDVREYDPALDGSDHFIAVEELRGKASYLAVRGTHYAPSALVKGRTATGRPCWFRSYDVTAVES